MLYGKGKIRFYDDTDPAEKEKLTAILQNAGFFVQKKGFLGRKCTVSYEGTGEDVVRALQALVGETLGYVDFFSPDNWETRRIRIGRRKIVTLRGTMAFEITDIFDDDDLEILDEALKNYNPADPDSEDGVRFLDNIMRGAEPLFGKEETEEQKEEPGHEPELF